MRSLLLASALSAVAAVAAAAQVAPTPPVAPVRPTPAEPVPVTAMAPEAPGSPMVPVAPLNPMAPMTPIAPVAPAEPVETWTLAALPTMELDMARMEADMARLESAAMQVAFDAPHLAMAAERLTTAAAHLDLVAEAPVTIAGLPAGAPRAWASQDPADSLYRAARETLNRSEYRRAAQLFRQVRERHPRSEYVSEAAYWEAFSLYRVGSTDDLKTALRVLDQQGSYSRKETQANADALQARILGALARRGDRDAEVRLAQAARNGTASCDSEDLMVRVEALNALSQLDQAAAMPLLRRVLARRDECSASLRRSAVSLAARRGGDESLGLLTEVALQDPNSGVRSTAVSNIAKMESEQASGALEAMLQSSDDGVRRTAARALMQRTDARSRRAMRAYLESPQTSEAQKVEAIHSFGKEHATADDVAYLRTLYGRTDSERVRSAIVTVLPRIAPEEGRVWLAGIARDANQPTSARAAAISALSRDGSVPVADLGRMYDAANERRIREQVVVALGRRSEPEATEKLIEIARNGTDPVIRTAAINQLARKKDPKLATLIQELIDR